VARIVARLDARDHVTFGGRLSERARGFIARQILQQGKGGDFRDREQIRAWAHDIAAELTAADATCGPSGRATGAARPMP
jgi:menaquinone-dependent protoporphyrinogen oxidase